MPLNIDTEDKENKGNWNEENLDNYLTLGDLQKVASLSSHKSP